MKIHKPTTPGRRGMKTVEYRKLLTPGTMPKKALTRGTKRAVGRNADGRITTRHKGAGHKRLYREVDFLYNKHDIPARIETIEYDPNRNAFISLACYEDGERRYVLAPKGTEVGDKFMVGENAPIKRGNRLPLDKIPVGTFVYNIEIHPGTGGKLVRSAGVYAEVEAQDGDFANIKMPSGEVRKINKRSYASVGSLSNDEYQLQNWGKAGKSRARGIRPTVRGSAMNPVDHPHGGGEGRQGIGLRRGPKTREGKQAFGVRTRRPKKYSNPHIVSRRRKKSRK